MDKLKKQALIRTAVAIALGLAITLAISGAMSFVANMLAEMGGDAKKLIVAGLLFSFWCGATYLLYLIELDGLKKKVRNLDRKKRRRK